MASLYWLLSVSIKPQPSACRSCRSPRVPRAEPAGGGGVTSATRGDVEDARAEYVRRYGPMPAGEFWVPAALGGSAPTLDEATVKDREDQQRRKEQRAAREQAKADRDRRNREELAAAPGPLRPVVRLRQRWRDRRRS